MDLPKLSAAVLDNTIPRDAITAKPTPVEQSVSPVPGPRRLSSNPDVLPRSGLAFLIPRAMAGAPTAIRRGFRANLFVYG